MKKLLVVILLGMICIGMSGIATSLAVTSKRNETKVSSADSITVEKTSTWCDGEFEKIGVFVSEYG